jgi:hypothetical protein
MFVIDTRRSTLSRFYTLFPERLCVIYILVYKFSYNACWSGRAVNGMLLCFVSSYLMITSSNPFRVYVLIRCRYGIALKVSEHGKMVSLFTQRAPSITRARVSTMCSFRWSIFCTFMWYTMAFKCLDKQVGWWMETSTGPRRPILWPGNLPV